MAVSRNIGSYTDMYVDQYSADIYVAITVGIPLPDIEATSELPPAINPVAVAAPVGIPAPVIDEHVTVTVTAVAAPASLGTPVVPVAGLVTITARDRGRFFRLLGASPRLVLPMGHGRSGAAGMHADEGWDIVSGRFEYNATLAGHEAAMLAVSAAWAANKNADTATLRAAINSSLNNAGYRDREGELLV